MGADFTPNMEEYSGQKTFRFWCQTVLPLVYDDSLSYYELLNKVVNYLNNVIEDISDVETNTEALYDAYNLLQGYVNDYFDNLDVDESISDKLDEMAANGELSALLAPIINAYATPDIVSDVADMTDPNRLYVLESNGRLYSYNRFTEEFVQSDLEYGIDELVFTGFTTLVSTSGILDDANDAHVNRAYAISANVCSNIPESTGALLTFSYHELSNSSGHIQLFLGGTSGILYSRIKWGAAPGTWSEWRATQDTVNLVKPFGSRITTDYAILEDADNATPNRIYTIGNAVTSNLPSGATTGTLIPLSYGMLNNSGHAQLFISANNTLYYRIRWGAAPGTWSSWKEVPNIDGVTRAYKTYGTRLSNATNTAAAISTSDANDALPNVIYTITAANLLANTAVNTAGTLFGFCGTNNNEGGYVQFFISSSTYKIYYRLKWGGSGGSWSTWREIGEGNISNVNSYSGSIGIYEKFGVIGDSFASGEVYTSGGTRIDNYYLSWGQILARMVGNTCINFSTSGLTTRSWLTNANGLTKLNSENACNMYMCNLGINDANSLGTSYLGTIADIHDGNPSANADTFYGNYGKIIEAIKAKAPNAHIIMVATMRNATVYQTFDAAIAEIAEHYGIPYLNVYDDEYFHSAGWTTQVSSHPTANDYAGIAMAINRLYSIDTVNNYQYYQNYTG